MDRLPRLLWLGTSLYIFATVSLPSQDYPALKFHLNQFGVFEDQCKVRLAGLNSNLCLDREVTFDIVAATASTAAGAAFILAYFLSYKVGPAWTALLGCLLNLLGTFVVFSRDLPQLIKTNVQYLWGYGLISAGAPLLLCSALTCVLDYGRWALFLSALLFTLFHSVSFDWWVLGSLQAAKDPGELFGAFMWLPITWSALVLTNMVVGTFSPVELPFAVISKTLTPHTAPTVYAETPIDAPQDDDLLLAGSVLIWGSHHIGEVSTMDRFKSWWFKGFLGFYLVQVLPLKLFIYTGIDTAKMYDDVDIAQYIIYWRPALAVFVSITLYLSLCLWHHLTVSHLYCALAVVSPIYTYFLKLTYWKTCAIAVGPLDVLFSCLSLVYFLGVFGPGSFGLVYAVFALLTAASEFLVPYATAWLWISPERYNDIISGYLWVQVAVSLAALYFLWKGCYNLKHLLLKYEAENALRLG